MSWRRVVVAAVLIGTMLVPVGAAPAAPSLSPAAVRLQLADATRDEERAWRLLASSQPRWETARLLLVRSLEQLRELRPDITGTIARVQLDEAISADIRALGRISERNRDNALRQISIARFHKSWTAGFLEPRRTAAAQCGDGRDNDGDRLVDARYDPGCASPKGGSEGAPLSCKVSYRAVATVQLVEGTCSGPFGAVELAAPAGAAFDRTRTPVVSEAVGCRFASAQKLECLMEDGLGNPRHRFSARLALALRPAGAAKGTVRITDFRGRAGTWAYQLPASEPESRVEVQLGALGPGSAYVAPATGEAKFRTVLSFTNVGRVPLPAGQALLEVSADKIASVSSTISGDREVVCTQTSPSAWSCPLPELRPQVRHHWTMFVATRETGVLQLEFAVAVPRSLDPTLNKPTRVSVTVQ